VANAKLATFCSSRESKVCAPATGASVAASSTTGRRDNHYVAKSFMSASVSVSASVPILPGNK
jgi:hypothetical protein